MTPSDCDKLCNLMSYLKQPLKKLYKETLQINQNWIIKNVEGRKEKENREMKNRQQKIKLLASNLTYE